MADLNQSYYVEKLKESSEKYNMNCRGLEEDIRIKISNAINVVFCGTLKYVKKFIKQLQDGGGENLLLHR